MMLSLLVATAESDPSIGATGPTMLYYDTPDIVWCAGNCIHWNTGSTHRLHSQEHLRSVLNLTARDVDFVTSCAVCIKSSAFRAIGLMDESYFIYYDETDWFARAQQAGWRVVHVPEALMWHKVSAAMGVASPATDYYMTRNAIRFVSKNGPGFSKLFGPSYVAARNLLAVAAYTLKSHQGKRSANRNARLLAIRDAMLGRWGKMGDDVARVCFPNR